MKEKEKQRSDPPATEEDRSAWSSTKNVAQNVGVAVAVVAITFGAVGRYQPTWFNYIPKVGFLFHLLATGKMPVLFVYDAWTPMKTFKHGSSLMI
jgi:hypothetical protein